MPLAATSNVQIDNDEVRVTEWRLAPGAATGHHTHGMDYVIVPVADGDMTIVAPDGSRSIANLKAGQSYFRKAGSSTTCSMNPQPRSYFSRSSSRLNRALRP